MLALLLTLVSSSPDANRSAILAGAAADYALEHCQEIYEVDFALAGSTIRRA